MTDTRPRMSAAALLGILDALERAGVEAWLDGGWGVDALLGEETRAHGDLDLVVRVADVPRLEAALRARGFTRRRGSPPDSVVLGDPSGLEVDVHAVAFDPAGRGRHRMEDGGTWVFPADAFRGRGAVEGRAVRCLSAEAQVLCHAQGYPPTEKDRRDMRLLADHFGVELPPSLEGAA